LKPALGKKHKTLSEKQSTAKRAVGMAQMEEGLPSKYAALNSNSSATKKRERDNLAKMLSYGWSLIQYGWGPHKTRLGHKHRGKAM
jgi:hypothetical protein